MTALPAAPNRARIRVLGTVASLIGAFLVIAWVHPVAARAGGSLSHGSLTMVSTRADGTSGPALPNTFGADEEAISDDGKVIAFVSPIPADQLVTDPVQTGHVSDTNNAADVFVWDSRVPGPIGPIVTLVSWNKNHNGTGDAKSEHPIMAPAGIGIVFESSATDLTSTAVGAFSVHLYAWVPLISEAFPVFMVDVSYQGGGSQSLASDASIGVSLVPPMARVAFTSHADDLIDPQQVDSHGTDQVYVRTYTLAPPSTQMASVASDGDGTVSGAGEPMISADAKHVVFSSGGDHLVGTVDPAGANIYERDLTAATTKLISADPGGDPTTGNNSPVVSADGGAVAWDDNDNALASGTPHPDNVAHVFYRNGNNPAQLVDTDSTGLVGCNSASNWPGLSLDGTMVVFESACSDIAANSTGNQVYARRMVAAPAVPALPDLVPRLVSANDAGTGSGNSDASICSGSNPPHCGASTNPGVVMNADGTAITFWSGSSNIAPVPNPPPPNFGTVNVFVRYTGAVAVPAKTVNLTANTLGQNADGDARDAVMSADGGSVAFVSLADDLVTPDTNEGTDVFESDIHNSFVFQPIAAVNEGDGSVLITVARSGNLGTTDSVEVKTGDGSTPDIPGLPPEITNPGNSNAVQPDDYTETDKTLIFPPGTVTSAFTVPIVDDATLEDPELFHVSLSAKSGAGSVALPGPLSEAYVVILDNDAPAQDWQVTTSQQPPAAAEVGDTVTVKATISVDAGADDLTVNSLASGAGTSGLDDVAFGDTTPFTVTAGGSKEVTATARVVAAPGTAGTKLQVSVNGTLGATTGDKTTSSDTIAVGEAVTAALSGAPAAVGLTDQIAYKITLTNASDTPVQLDVPAAGYAVPTGTTLANRTDGSATLAANSSTDYLLTVDVADSDADGATITEAPTSVTYAMSDVSLAARPVPVNQQSSTVQAPVVSVSAHGLTDHDGGILLAGDTVDVSVTVANDGAADATGTLVDTLSGLQNPTGVQLDGGACGACSTTSTSVTAPLGTIAASGSHVVTYSATVGAVSSGTVVTSSGVVTFSPATTGTSPTTADVASLTVGSANTQDWHVTISQAPPASAHVGDTITVKAKIAVDAGADDLQVTDVSAGAGTSGLDQVAFGGSTPFTVTAGSSKTVTATARVTAAPATGGAHLQVSVAGQLGAAATATKSVDTGDVTVDEAVTATLTGGAATVLVTDQITYTLQISNASDTAVQLSGLPAGLVAPTGSTQNTRTDGASSIAAHGSTTWSLTVDVDDNDADQSVITQAPTVNYAMSAVGLSARSVPITPASVSSTVSNDTTKPDVTIEQAAAQADPTSTSPIDFTATFTEPVTGFAAGDVDLSGSTAGGSLMVNVSGGPTVYTVAVSGMTTDGTVLASIPAGVAQDGSANTNTASTSSDHSVTWQQKIASTTGVALTPTASVYGQAVTATATVGVTSGTADGTVQFAVDGTDVGSPVTVTGGTALSPALTGSGGVPLPVGSRHVTATFAPTDAATYAGSSGSADIVVDQAATTTTVVVKPHALEATVVASAPGGGAPDGTVDFAVDGSPVGSAPVVAGTATLSYTTPAGMAHSIGAVYSGSASYLGSSDSTARHDPSITAHLTSAHAKSASGWYRSPVTVSFTCATHGAPLTASCPAAVTLTHQGAARVVTRTISATDGGVATVSVSINLDRTAPTVTVKGVLNGGRYARPGPSLKCAAADALSGVASCTVTRHAHTASGTTTVHYRATARDKAGNVRTVTGTYRLVPIALVGAVFANGAYTVHRGHTYLLQVHSVTRPAYYDATPFPGTPFQPDPVAMHRAGHHLWSLPVTMEHRLHSHRYWNIGIKIGGSMRVLKLRVLG